MDAVTRGVLPDEKVAKAESAYGIDYQWSCLAELVSEIYFKH